jgi:ribonuclease HII
MESIFKGKNLIGADETGVGDYLTPLVATAVFVSKENIKKLKKIGIKDSKKLNDKKILEIFEKIKPIIKSSTRYFLQEEYNKLNKKYNANELKMYLHMMAINSLEKRIKNVDFILLDAFSNDNSLNKYIQKLKKDKKIKDIKNKIIFKTKAEDKHISVAIASIIARSYFIKLMENQNKK